MPISGAETVKNLNTFSMQTLSKFDDFQFFITCVPWSNALFWLVGEHETKTWLCLWYINPPPSSPSPSVETRSDHCIHLLLFPSSCLISIPLFIPKFTIMLAVASLKRSLEFDPVEQGVKRKRAEIKLPSANSFTLNTSLSPSKQPPQPASPLASSRRAPKKSSLFTNSTTDDIPMFTNLQTAQMCARLLREQDRSIREQYEQLLTSKLNEQYDTFVRYSHDSVHKNPSKPVWFNYAQQQESTPSTLSPDFSYVSWTFTVSVLLLDLIHTSWFFSLI